MRETDTQRDKTEWRRRETGRACSVPKEEMGRWCSPLGNAKSTRCTSTALWRWWVVASWCEMALLVVYRRWVGWWWMRRQAQRHGQWCVRWCELGVLMLVAGAGAAVAVVRAHAGLRTSRVPPPYLPTPTTHLTTPDTHTDTHRTQRETQIDRWPSPHTPTHLGLYATAPCSKSAFLSLVASRSGSCGFRRGRVAVCVCV